MKKLLSLFLILVMLTSVFLGGCGMLDQLPEIPGLNPEAPGTDPGASTNVCANDSDHTDGDNNGRCDSCNLSVIVNLDLFAINDLHGKFCDTDTQAGVDEMTTYLKRAYAREEHVLVLSSGDMWQGSSESNLTKGAIITEWLNEVDAVSMTLGNHEYDWGEEFITQNAALAEFPFLAINVYDTDTNKRAEYCQPSVLVQRGGASIGIIGAIGDCHSSISGEVSGGVYFKTGNELTSLVKEESAKLRAAGADFIVYSIHDGYGQSTASGVSLSDSAISSYYDTVLSDGYVDIVFEGHSHQSYIFKDSKGVFHLQGGGDNRGLCHAEANINFANGTGTVSAVENVTSSKYEHMTDDPIVQTLMNKYSDQVSAGTRVLGNNAKDRDSEELSQLIAELYMKAGLERFGSSYDIVLGGGYISVRSPYSLPAGEVTYSQLQMLFPFDNDLVLCSIKGSDLSSRFINNSHQNYFEGYSEYGLSVKNNIDPNATYYVVVDTFSSTYADNKLTEIARYTPGVYARDLLADYIEDGGLTVQPDQPDQNNYTPIPELLQRGEQLADNATTEESFYVKGTVVDLNNTTYGNFYLQDAQGNRLYIYGLYDANGTRYDAMSRKPVNGDTIVVYGQLYNYVNYQNGDAKLEIKSAILISFE